MIVSNTKNSSLFYQLTPTKQKSTFKCPECNKTFVSYYGLFQHFESHPTRNLRLNPPKFLQHQSSIQSSDSYSHSNNNNNNNDSPLTTSDSPYASSAAAASFIPSQHQQAQLHLPKHKIGFADLSFIDFSCINFPRIAQYNCELYPRKIIQTTNQTLTLTSHTCELCKCSFPCEASLKLHQFKNYETNRQCKLYMGYNQQYECVQKTLDDIISTIEDKYETNLNNNNKANFLFKFGLIKRDYVDEYVLNMKLKEKLRLKYLLNDYNKQYIINLDKWKQMHMMQLNSNSTTATITNNYQSNCLNLNTNTLTTNTNNTNMTSTAASYEALIDQQSIKIYLKPNVNHSRALLIRLKKFKKSKFNGVNGVVGASNGGSQQQQQTHSFIYSNHAHIADILALNYSRILTASTTTTTSGTSQPPQLTNISNNTTATNNGGKKRKSQQSVTPIQSDIDTATTTTTTTSSSIGVVKKKFKNSNDENIKEEKQQHKSHHKRSSSSTTTTSSSSTSNIASTIASVSSLKKPPPLHKPVKTESVVVVGSGSSSSEMPKLQPISALKQQSQQSSPDKPTAAAAAIKLPKLTPSNQTRKSLPAKLTIKQEPTNTTKQAQQQEQDQLDQQQSENNNNSSTNNENKTFKCKYCPSKFRSDSDFIKHVLTSHSKMLKERLNRQESLSNKSAKRKLNQTINTTTPTPDQPSIDDSEPQQQQEQQQELTPTNNEINNITVA